MFLTRSNAFRRPNSDSHPPSNRSTSNSSAVANSQRGSFSRNNLNSTVSTTDPIRSPGQHSINLKKIDSQEKQQFSEQTLQHLQNSFEQIATHYQGKYNLPPEHLSGLTQKALHSVIYESYAFSNKRIGSQMPVNDPMNNALQHALGSLNMTQDLNHVHQVNTPENLSHYKHLLKDMVKTFRAFVPMEDTEFCLSDTHNAQVSQKFTVPQIADTGVHGFSEGTYKVNFLDHMMYSSDEAKHSGRAIDHTDKAVNTGIIAVNNKVIVGRSGRTDTQDKLLQVLALNAKEAFHSNHNSTENGHGFVDGQFQMMITSAMDLSKSKSFFTGTDQSIKNKLSQIFETKDTIVKRVRNSFNMQQRDSNRDSKLSSSSDQSDKPKVRLTHVGNNELEQFIKIEDSINSLFGKGDGRSIQIEIPTAEGAVTTIEIAKPLLTNMTLSNQGESQIYSALNKANNAVTSQHNYNSKHTVPKLTAKILKKLDEEYSQKKESTILDLSSMNRNYYAKPFLELVNSLGTEKPNQKEQQQLRQLLLGLDASEKSEANTTLVNGLSYIYTQLTSNNYKNDRVQNNRAYEFIQLRSALKLAGMAQTVQCKSGMDRTLTMASLSLAHEMNPALKPGNDDHTAYLNRHFSESLVQLGYKPCARNRGQMQKVTGLMKNLKHIPTLRMLDKKIYNETLEKVRHNVDITQPRLEIK